MAAPERAANSNLATSMQDRLQGDSVMHLNCVWINATHVEYLRGSYI